MLCVSVTSRGENTGVNLRFTVLEILNMLLQYIPKYYIIPWVDNRLVARTVEDMQVVFIVFYIYIYIFFFFLPRKVHPFPSFIHYILMTPRSTQTSKVQTHNSNCVVKHLHLNFSYLKLDKTKFEPVLPFPRTCSFLLTPFSSTTSSKLETQMSSLTFSFIPVPNLINFIAPSCYCQVLITCLDYSHSLLTALSPPVLAPSNPFSTLLQENFLKFKSDVCLLKTLHSFPLLTATWHIRYFRRQFTCLSSHISSLLPRTAFAPYTPTVVNYFWRDS